MVRARQVLERGAVDDRPRPSDTGRRGEVHQQVAEHRAQRMTLRGAERGGDEVVLGVRQGRRGNAVEAPLAREVLALPLVLGDVAVAEIDDAGRAALEDRAERGRLGPEPQQPRAEVRDLLEVGAGVRGAEADHIAYEVLPGLTGRRGVVGGGAYDEAAHRVADEGDAGDRHGPGLHELLEQGVEVLAVLGDVQAGVVADHDRRAVGLGDDALGVRRAAPRRRWSTTRRSRTSRAGTRPGDWCRRGTPRRAATVAGTSCPSCRIAIVMA